MPRYQKDKLPKFLEWDSPAEYYRSETGRYSGQGVLVALIQPWGDINILPGYIKPYNDYKSYKLLCRKTISSELEEVNLLDVLGISPLYSISKDDLV